jgi:hypothetical protein
MGGPNSGPRDGKNCTDDLRSFDIRELARVALLTPGTMFSWNWNRSQATTGSVLFWVELDQVIFNYRSTSARYVVTGSVAPSYSVALDWTHCRLGGRRAWWNCPALGCGRRVAVLYAGSVFACRRCHRLGYRSQREHDHDRAVRRADAIRERLGWEPGILNGCGAKPKGMHRTTFDTLRAKHDVLVGEAVAGFLDCKALRRR